MPLTRVVLNRWLHWGALGIIVVLLGGAAWQQSANPIDLPRPIARAVAALAVAGLLWCLVDAARNSANRTALRVWVVFGLGCAVLQWWADFASVGARVLSPLLMIMCSAFAIAGFAFNLRIGLVVSGLVPLIVLTSGSGVGQSADVGWVAVTMFAGGVVATVVIDRLQRAAGDVETAVTQAWRERVAASRDEAQAAAQENWDGLVHDKVLGSLLLAGRSRSEAEDSAAAELALDALAAFDRQAVANGEQFVDLASHVGKLAGSLGLQLSWTGPQEVAGLTVDATNALRDALDQAVVNVARHAECDQVEVTVAAMGDMAAMAGSTDKTGKTGDAGGVEVTLRDDGKGFDPLADMGQRRGIQDGIRGRLERVGGRALITTAPGSGTTVTLQLPLADRRGDWLDAGASPLGAGVSGESMPGATWRGRGFAPVYATGLFYILTNSCAAVANQDRVQSVAVMTACLLAVLAAYTSLTLLPQTARRWARVMVVVAAFVPFVATWNLTSPGEPGWEYWFVGSCSAIAAAVVFRWSRWWAVPVVLGVVAGLPGGQAVRQGTVIFAPIADAMPQVFAYFAAASGVRAALDHASGGIARASAEAGVARVAAARADEAGEVAMQRVRELGHVVGNQLQSIARGLLTPESRVHCLALEAQARDILVAGPLLTPALTAAIAAARRRGAKVIVTAERGDMTGVDSFRRALAVALQRVPSAGVVRALWRPDSRQRLGSISIVGPLDADDRARDWVAAVGPDVDATISVSIDELSILFSFGRAHHRALTTAGMPCR